MLSILSSAGRRIPILNSKYAHACASVNVCGCSSSSGPILALVLAKENAIAEWRKLLGPTSSKRARQEDPESLRAKYGTDDTRNGLHGSDSQYSAEREIRFLFPGCELTLDTLCNCSTCWLKHLLCF